MVSTQQRAVWIGALIGIELFLLAGLVPSLLYGRDLGLMIGANVNAAPLEPGDLASVTQLAGMAVGLMSACSLFLVVGAAMGALATCLVGMVVPATRERERRLETEAAWQPAPMI